MEIFLNEFIQQTLIEWMLCARYVLGINHLRVLTVSQNAKLISRKPLLFKMAISSLCKVWNFGKFQTTLLLVHLIVWIIRPQNIMAWIYLFISHQYTRQAFRIFIAAGSYYGARLPLNLYSPLIIDFCPQWGKKRERKKNNSYHLKRMT